MTETQTQSSTRAAPTSPLGRPASPLAGRLACLALISVVVSLGLRPAVTTPVCVLGTALLVAVLLVLPRLDRSPWADTGWRPWLGMIGMGVVLVAGWIWPEANTFATFADMKLPDVVPTGFVAVFAVGVLVAVGVETGSRVGLFSAVMASTLITFLGDATVDGRHMLAGILLGWPAALAALALTLDRSAGPPVPAPRRTRRMRPATTVATTGVVVLGAALVVAGHVGPAESVDPGPVGWGPERARAGAGAPDRTLAGYLDGNLDVRSRGELGDRPFAQVPASSPRLWRAGFYNEYNSVSGHGWTTTNRTSATTTFLQSDFGGTQIIPPYVDAQRMDQARERTDVVTVRREGPAVVLSPGEATSVDSVELNTGLAFLKTQPGGRMLLQGDLLAGSSYTVGSTELDDTDDGVQEWKLKGIPTIDPSATAEFKELYLQLPISVPQRVRELGAKLVRQAPDRISAIKAVEAEVRSRIAYREDAPVTPLSDDVVDDALFVTHEGFRDQFASAEAVLLRAGGIPTRVAVGFDGGQRKDGVRVLRDKDVDVWVEAWVPGSGWATSDPAPAPQAKLPLGQRISRWATDAGLAVYENTIGRPVRMALDLFIILVTGAFLVTVHRRRRSVRST